ncbi:MAG: YtxH domain-containing protein [Anaerolineae bacterium]
MGKHKGGFSSFLGGFFIGGLIGAATGLLFAPQSGEETREQLIQKAEALSDQAYEEAEKAQQRAQQLLDEARAKVEEASQEIKAGTQELQEKVESTT